MPHSKRFIRAVKRIYKLIRKVKNPESVGFAPKIPKSQKGRYITHTLMPDGTIESEKWTGSQ